MESSPQLAIDPTPVKKSAQRGATPSGEVPASTVPERVATAVLPQGAGSVAPTTNGANGTAAPTPSQPEAAPSPPAAPPKLTEFLDLATLQDIQDSRAMVAQVKAAILDTAGQPLTQTPVSERF